MELYEIKNARICWGGTKSVLQNKEIREGGQM